MTARYALRFGALGYLAFLLLVPVGLVFYRTFEHGLHPAWAAVTNPQAQHALWLTLLIAAIAVPANTVFGVVLAIALVRHRFPGRGLVNAVVDLPLALSPVVVGPALFTTFRRITLPAIRWAVGYGVVLTTARAIGEFGAVSVVSGRIEGKTETLPLYVQSQFEGFNTTGAFAASVVLALIALATVLCMRMFRPKEAR